MLEHERLELANNISARFKDVTIPKRKIGDLEELDIFVGKQWHEITIEDINQNRGLLFFSPEGFRYYLPSYLVTILRYPNEVSQEAKIKVLEFLKGSYIEIELFSAKQREAILNFVIGHEYEDIYRTGQSFSANKMGHYIDKQKTEFLQLRQNAINFWKQ